ncbi:hypothetical protein GPZ80_20380 [Actinokineospora sp. HBU206404]|uniref:Glycosyl transferase family 1 n=2 Tax=Actinokineospora xionganensis TaxID=2684470 RepID=A0ABR7LA03_9PSEU|nr:hypothetical protein [Actinokineospora xionganensis]
MDALASPATDETFGLAIIEAVATGLPMLYTTCPALEDVSPIVAPRAARKLPCDAIRYRDELAALRAARPMAHPATSDSGSVRHRAPRRTARTAVHETVAREMTTSRATPRSRKPGSADHRRARKPQHHGDERPAAR